MDLRRITIKDGMDVLRQISTDVDFEKDCYHEWIDALRQYCQNNVVYALAPVQIGIPKRMIYLRNTTPDMTKNKDSSYDEGIVIINPTILDASGHTEFPERCESCLDYVAIVDRPYSVNVEYYDINGQKLCKAFRGFEATVFSHEYDHLNGILHIDLSEIVQQMTWEETRAYRELHPYKVLSEYGNYDFASRKINKK